MLGRRIDLFTKRAVEQSHNWIRRQEILKTAEVIYASHTNVPWTPIAGMRDKLIHAYDIVDFDEVWKTVDTDVPALLSLLEPLLPNQE